MDGMVIKVGGETYVMPMADHRRVSAAVAATTFKIS